MMKVRRRGGEIFQKYHHQLFRKLLSGKQYSVPYFAEYPINMRKRHLEAIHAFLLFTNDTVICEYLILLNYRARASRGIEKRFDLADVFTPTWLGGAR